MTGQYYFGLCVTKCFRQKWAIAKALTCIDGEEQKAELSLQTGSPRLRAVPAYWSNEINRTVPTEESKEINRPVSRPINRPGK